MPFLKWAYATYFFILLIEITFLKKQTLLLDYTNDAGDLILLIMCFLSLVKLMNRITEAPVLKVPFTWFVFAVLTYYAGNFVVFLVNNYVPLDVHPRIWAIHNLMNITKNILFAIALWQTSRIHKFYI